MYYVNTCLGFPYFRQKVIFTAQFHLPLRPAPSPPPWPPQTLRPPENWWIKWKSTWGEGVRLWTDLCFQTRTAYIWALSSASGKKIQIHLYRWVRLNNSRGLDNVSLNALWSIWLNRDQFISQGLEIRLIIDSGKPLSMRSAVQMEIRQIAFQPPPPRANGRFVGNIFAENR